MPRLAFVVVLLLAVPALAASEEDAAYVEACIAQRGDAAASCIGAVAGPCQEQPGGETTVGIVNCPQLETTAWDLLLNRYYKELLASEAEPARTTLRDAQRAWIAWRDTDCRFAYEQFLDRSLRQVTGAACQRDGTAERVLHLHGFLNFGN